MPDTDTIKAPPTQPETPPPGKPPARPPTEAAPPADQKEPEGESYIEKLLGRKMTKKDAPAPKKEADPKDETPPPKAKTKVAAKPVAAAKPIQPPPEAPDYDKIAEAAGRGVAEVMDRKKDEPAKSPQLTAAHQKRMDTLSRMEKLYPEDTGRAREYAESLRKTVEYQSAWEQQHPGQEFDKDAAEHNEFFEKNDVDWDDDHYREAEDAIREDKIAGRISEKTDRKLQELEAKEELQAATPKLAAARNAAAKNFFDALGADYAKVLDKDGNVDRAEADRLVAEDSLKHIAFNGVRSAEAFTYGVNQLLLKGKNGQRLVEFAGTAALEEKLAQAAETGNRVLHKELLEQIRHPSDRTRLHDWIAANIDSQEKLITSKPASEQINDSGQRFATAAEYDALPPEKRKLFWRLWPEDHCNIFIAEEARRVSKSIAAEELRIEQAATSRGYKKPAPASNNGEHQPDKEEASPRSPAGPVEPRMAQPVVGQQESSKEAWLSRL